MVPGIVPLLDGMFGPMGGYLGPWMRTLTLWVERGRGVPMLHVSGPAAHERVSATTCRAQVTETL